MSQQVEVGQIWADKDPRSAGRTVLVKSIEAQYATVVVVSDAKSAWRCSVGHRRRVLLYGLTSRFRLVS